MKKRSLGKKKAIPGIVAWAGLALFAMSGSMRPFAAEEPPAPDSRTVASEATDATPTVEALVTEAMRQSPLVAAARHRWESSTKVPKQVSTLPDPEVTLQEFTVGGPRPLEGYETNDFYYTGVGFSQDIPWPTKLGLQAAQARQETEYARYAYEAARREVAEKVRESYFELFFTGKALAILEQTRAELSRIEKITEAHYRFGQGNEEEVNKAQLEMTSVLEQIEMRREEAGQRQAELKSLLGRDIDSANIAIGEVTPSHPKFDSAQVRGLADERSPELKMAQAMEAKSTEALKLAHANYMPDLSLGYMYQKTGPGLRDYYMLTVGAKIPLYFWRKQTPAVEQAVLDNSAARSDARAQQLEVHSSAESELVAMDTAARVITLYRDGLIPQADATRDTAMNAYSVGKADFQTLISAVIDVLNLNQGYYRALADHEIAVARIQQIIGDEP